MPQKLCKTKFLWLQRCVMDSAFFPTRQLWQLTNAEPDLTISSRARVYHVYQHFPSWVISWGFYDSNWLVEIKRKGTLSIHSHLLSIGGPLVPRAAVTALNPWKLLKWQWVIIMNQLVLIRLPFWLTSGVRRRRRRPSFFSTAHFVTAGAIDLKLCTYVPLGRSN
jgi:hypothetical protein